MTIALQHPCSRRFSFYQEVLSFKQIKVWNYRRQLSEAAPYIISFMLLMCFSLQQQDFDTYVTETILKKNIKLNQLGIKIMVLFKSIVLLSNRPPCEHFWENSVGSRHLQFNFYVHNTFLIIVTWGTAESIDRKTYPLLQIRGFFSKRQFCVPKAH